MARALVTGGAGFIGSHLVESLLEKGFEVLVIDNLATGKKENLSPQAHFYQLDLRDLESIKPLFQGVDFVFHLAANSSIRTSIQYPSLTHDNNLTATLNVLISAKEAGVKKVVYASSAAVYGDQESLPHKEEAHPRPLNLYGVQKYAGELYCRNFSELYGLPTVSLRYFNVYGPRLPEKGDEVGVVSIFLRQKKEGKPLTIVGDGSQKRDFVFVKDIAEGTILAALAETEPGEVFNLGSGERYSIKEVAEMFGGEIAYLEERKGEIKESCADISKAKEKLGWQPKVSLKEGLKITAKFYGIELP